jgi:hypothetical protein
MLGISKKKTEDFTFARYLATRNWRRVPATQMTRYREDKVNANDMKLKTIIDNMANQGDREITKAMCVLISALKVGPILDRLMSETGYPPQFVGPIVSRMQQAELWRKDFIDDREWWDSNGDLNGAALFGHALVALGQVKRESTPSGARYIDIQTANVVGEWHCRNIN